MVTSLQNHNIEIDFWDVSLMTPDQIATGNLNNTISEDEAIIFPGHDK